MNGPRQIYVERRGKLVLTDIRFRNDAHVLHVAQRIASAIGRRVDESSPMLDARLADGSRVNVVIPPLSLKGPCISIRKFTRSFLDFSQACRISRVFRRSWLGALEIAAQCRLNILISGGTGSGKTTLLNAMSSLIDPGERDRHDRGRRRTATPAAACRPRSRPGRRMSRARPGHTSAIWCATRCACGPTGSSSARCAVAEAFDMMQAMNTGHNGSMSTVHANTARDALARVENMVLMANVNLPSRAIRGQMVSALDLIVQIERMRDGTRRVTELTEVVGMEGDVITLSATCSRLNTRARTQTEHCAALLRPAASGRASCRVLSIMGSAPPS